LYFFPHISCLDWTGCCRSRLPKPNAVYGHFVAVRGPSYSFADHSCLPRAVLPVPGRLVLLSESSQIILALFQLFFAWCMFSLLALAVCSLDMCGSFLFFSSCFSFGVAPFIPIPILAFYLISHPLSLSGRFHFVRLASGPEP